MRLFRTIFFLGVVAVLMPSPPEEAKRSSLLSSSADVTVPQLINAASRTVSDAGEFCGRQPMVCVTADFIATKLEAKAKYSAKLIYEWANEASSTPGPREAFENAPQRASLAQLSSSNELSQNTLKVEDLVPSWRDPRSARKS